VESASERDCQTTPELESVLSLAFERWVTFLHSDWHRHSVEVPPARIPRGRKRGEKQIHTTYA